MSRNLDGVRALVTGASKGMASPSASGWQQKGRIVATGRDTVALDRLAHGLEARHGAGTVLVPADLADPHAVTPLWMRPGRPSTASTWWSTTPACRSRVRPGP